MYALSLMPNDHDTPISRSRLVIVTAQRTRQLMQGATTGTMTKHSKPTTIALEEVLAGRVKFLTGKEAVHALVEARKQREKELRLLAVAHVAVADAGEIKKDLSVLVDDSKALEASED